MSFKITFKTRWADFDANKHMRHTAYNDYAAEARLRFLTDNGFGADIMDKNNIGPVLFSENTVFKREIKLGEDITLALFLEAASKQGERFKIRHYIYRQNGELAAIISIYLAWIDVTKRKLTIPPKEIIETLKHIEKTDDFEELIIKK
jgi:acyl-CoA thioester hydrolase